MYKIFPFSYKFSENLESKKIFCNETINLENNQTIAIVGPSGGGKTTYLKLLKGIIPEYSAGVLEGKILFNGNSLSGIYFKENLRKIFYLFQNPFTQLIYPTTEEEFFFSMENFNFPLEEMQIQKEIFEHQFKLEKVWGKKTNQLSNGECQRLVLASILSVKPSVILLDEPTAFLDPLGRKEFYQYLKQMKNEHMLIIVDHHLEEIYPLVDRVIEVSESGHIREMPKEHLLKKNYISESLPSLSFMHQKKSTPVSLIAENVSFSYDKRHSLLKSLNASFLGGEVVILKGDNGAGKSTFLKILAGIISSDQGNIIFTDGKKRLKNKKIFPKVGFVFQNPESHFFFDTIKEELEQSLKFVKDEKLKEQLFNVFLKKVDLGKSPFLLSEGEKRRLSILMNVFLGKEILFFDEPTFGQDMASKEQIQNLILELKKLGVIQIIISHDEDFIQKVSDRVLLLSNSGEIK